MPIAPRVLRKHWQLTAIAVFSLSVAMALVIVSLSITNTALLLPPAAPNPDRLVTIYNHTPEKDVEQISYPDFQYLRQNNHVFTDVAAAPNSIGLLIDQNFNGREARVMMRPVSANYFDVMGIRPFLGRYFSEKDKSGSDSTNRLTAIMTWACWQRLGADRNIIGKQFGEYTIIGITPREFTGAFYGLNGDLLTLLEAGDLAWTTQRQNRSLILIARLLPAITRRQAQAALTGLSAQIAAAYPKEDLHRTAVVTRATLLPPDALPTARLATGILVGLVLLVLLIASANVANLLLALAVGRRQEAAIKLALGAARARLIREFLRESAVICSISAVLGYALAASVISRFADLSIGFPMYGVYSFGLNLHLDLTVVALTLALMLLAILAAGLAPALYASSPNISGILSGELVIGGTGKRLRRNTLVFVQVAVCTLTLVGLGLCLRNLYNLRHTDFGFSARNLVALTLYLKRDDPEARGRQMYSKVDSAVTALPGVEAVTLARDLPLFGGAESQPIRLPGSLKSIAVEQTVVDARYFSTLGIPVLQGRNFNNADRPNTPVAIIVNRKMAETFWPGQTAVGRQVLTGDKGEQAIVVGVVADGKYESLDEASRPYLYYALSQRYQSTISVIARTAGEPTRWINSFDKAIRDAGYTTPARPDTLSHWLNLTLLGERVVAGCVAALSALGLLLAAIGLAGSVASAVSQRTRELGLRVALGASSGQLLRMVLRQVLTVAGAGVTLGLALGITAASLLRAKFYKVGPLEWTVLLPVAVTMLTVALLVAWLAARPWLNADPMTAVRHN